MTTTKELNDAMAQLPTLPVERLIALWKDVKQPVGLRIAAMETLKLRAGNGREANNSGK